MLKPRSALVLGVCVVTLCGCGSAASSDRQRKTIIASELRKLQLEVEQKTRSLDRGKLGSELLDVQVNVRTSPPPKGIGAAEWRAAVQHDQALKHALSRASLRAVSRYEELWRRLPEAHPGFILPKS